MRRGLIIVITLFCWTVAAKGEIFMSAYMTALTAPITIPMDHSISGMQILGHVGIGYEYKLKSDNLGNCLAGEIILGKGGVDDSGRMTIKNCTEIALKFSAKERAGSTSIGLYYIISYSNLNLLASWPRRLVQINSIDCGFGIEGTMRPSSLIELGINAGIQAMINGNNIDYQSIGHLNFFLRTNFRSNP